MQGGAPPSDEGGGSGAPVRDPVNGGVARDSKAVTTKTVRGKKVKAASKYRPKVSKALYTANKGLDRDKDGIACEK